MDYGWRASMEGIEQDMNVIHQQTTIHGRYIQVYDAMSLSSIEIDSAGNISGLMPKLDGCMLLFKDLMDLFNKTYIRQHGFLSKLREEIEIAASSADSVLSTSFLPNSRDVEAVPSVKLIDIDEVVEETNVPTIATSSVDVDEVSSIQKNQVKSTLRQIYISLTSFIDVKLALLQCTQEIVRCYEKSIKALAEQNGVLHAGIKYHIVVQPFMDSLLGHKLFNTVEEHNILTRTRALWGKVVLNGSSSQELIDKDMVRSARESQFSSKTKYLPLQIGAACVLLLWAISECLNNEQSSAKIWNDPTFAIFMCIGDFLLLQLMWGVSMYVWKKAGIDFIQLLSLQHTELAESKAPALLPINSVTQLSIVFLVVFIVFNKLVRWSVKGYFTIAYAHILPVLLCIFILYRAFFPFSTRKVWLAMFGRVLAAPGFSVIFRDGFIGDILTSLVRVWVPCAFSLMYICISVYAWLFNDLRWTVSTSDDWWTHNAAFHYILIPILTIYPLWIRLVQCLRRSVETGHRWPHMVNGLKYTSAIVVISLATFQPSVRQNSLWILSFVGATVFQFVWDIFQDWGMVNISLPGNGNVLSATVELRSKRLLGSTWLYIVVMVFNLVLRFAWTLTLLPSPEPEDGFSFYAVVVSHIGPIVAAAEIVRRMIWGFYRLEWEQIEILQKNTLNTSTSNAIDGMSKMTMGTSVNAGSPVSSFSTAAVSRQSFKHDDDWTSLLPSTWLSAIEYAIPGSSWKSKVRLLESVLFAAAVALFVLQAALRVAHP